jgi:hypothetical protein
LGGAQTSLADKRGEATGRAGQAWAEDVSKVVGAIRMEVRMSACVVVGYFTPVFGKGRERCVCGCGGALEARCGSLSGKSSIR